LENSIFRPLGSPSRYLEGDEGTPGKIFGRVRERANSVEKKGGLPSNSEAPGTGKPIPGKD